MATEGIYVIETEWTHDNVNHEFATLTVEKPEKPIEDLIFTGRGGSTLPGLWR